jgi:rSAM/selenodomain-associated transferase 1
VPITKNTNSNNGIIVFAKAPIPGEVKTRMIPAFGAENAALLHTALVERVLETATRTGAIVELCCAPDASHSFFAACAEDFEVMLTEQGAGDLGERMLRALDDALATCDRAILIGADCPAFTAKHLQRALQSLDEADVVLTPADDGGYVLVGARRTAPGMFSGIAWGTHQVLDAQRARLAACGLTWHEMETLWDVDRPADLERLRQLQPPLAYTFAA